MEKKKICVGVVGAGMISDVYLDNMIHRFHNLRVKSICARHTEHAKRKAGQYGLQPCTLEEMLADPEIEMIVNLTPVGEHYAIIKDALMAGKHVYTEKTITDQYEQAMELSRLADQRNLYLGSAPDTFLGASLQTARKAIDDGLIGEVTSCIAASNRDNHFLLSHYPFLLIPGAGVCYDYAVYYMTSLVSLLGAVEETAAFVSTPFPKHRNINPDSPDYGKMMNTPNESRVSAILKFRSGVTGTFHMDQDSVWKDQADMVIYGTKGMLYLGNPDRFGDQVRLLSNPEDRQEDPRMQVLPFANDYIENARGIGPSEMAEAILSGTPARVGKELACHVLEVLSAILRSGEQKTVEKIHSVCERPERYY